MPIRPVSEHIAAQNWDLSSKPKRRSAWVDELVVHATVLRDRLAQVQKQPHALSAASTHEVRPEAFSMADLALGVNRGFVTL